MGDYTVDTDGSITVTFGSDDDGVMTASYLASLDGYAGEQAATCSFYLNDVLTTVTVPVVIGQGYTSEGQTLRPATQNDLQSPSGAGLGKTRRAHWFAALLNNTHGVKFGTDFSNTLVTARLAGADGETLLTALQLYSDVYVSTLNDDYSQDSMITWYIARPYPVTVCSISAFLHGAER